jgi:hypothetical protein
MIVVLRTYCWKVQKLKTLMGKKKKKNPPVTFSNHAIDQNLKVIMFRIFG